MKLNHYGEIADTAWKNAVNYYNNIELDEFIVMPNHIHGILFLLEDNVTEQCSVTTVNGKNYGKLSKIVKSYKEAVTKQIKNIHNNNEFTWQRSFYDHIIRDDEGLNKIREYIKYNPLKWNSDRDKINNLEILA